MCNSLYCRVGVCETSFQATGIGQYIQNKGNLPLRRSPFMYILTDSVTCGKSFAITIWFDYIGLFSISANQKDVKP